MRVQAVFCGLLGQTLANTAWAFATAHQLDDKLLKAQAKEAERWVSEFNVQELANTAWAFATVHHLDGAMKHSMTNPPRHPDLRVLQGASL